MQSPACLTPRERSAASWSRTTRACSGPITTMLLADLGAKVVKVERPDASDDTLAWASVAPDGEAPYYLRREPEQAETVTLDLRDPGDLESGARAGDSRRRRGRELRPGVMARYGLDGPAGPSVEPKWIAFTAGIRRTRPRRRRRLRLLAQAVGGLDINAAGERAAKR